MLTLVVMQFVLVVVLGLILFLSKKAENQREDKISENQLRLASVVGDFENVGDVEKESPGQEVAVMKIDRQGNLTGRVLYFARFVRQVCGDRSLIRKPNGAIVRRSNRRLMFVR